MRQFYPLHHFYIPVMGTSFTVDSALFVAKYGIETVVSLVDDLLLEQMRAYWSKEYGLPYHPITSQADDPRAERITAYLNLLQQLVEQQIQELQRASFHDSALNRFFRLLPETHAAKQEYLATLKLPEGEDKQQHQAALKKYIVPGAINVNIMAKLDPAALDTSVEYHKSAAAAALRGFANSELRSMIVLSAGFNPYLYSYLGELADFYPNEKGEFRKRICLKVSDYRSALVQGKFLAKKGLWVSEYRFESPVNCGGHAFVNDGKLMGPILAEFADKRSTLHELLWPIYTEALYKRKQLQLKEPLDFAVTAQGGVGTAAEHELLRREYGLDAIGWGSPFLLVPEVTNVDEDTLDKLVHAKEEEIVLSENSPLGVLFWTLSNSLSEEERRRKIAAGRPGSPCVKGFVRFSKEFTSYPLCLASREYQKAKLAQLDTLSLSPEEKAERVEQVVTKACICNDLAGGALIKREIDLKATTTICPGPNVRYFKQRLSLDQLVDHLYGRSSLPLVGRPHLFLNELDLQVRFWLKEAAGVTCEKMGRSVKVLLEARSNLLEGIDYYLKHFTAVSPDFSDRLYQYREQLEKQKVAHVTK